MRSTLLLLILALLLAGCGQSGPLYLPDDPSQIRPAPGASSPEEENEEPDSGG